jgi:hypothetical protein
MTRSLFPRLMGRESGAVSRLVDEAGADRDRSPLDDRVTGKAAKFCPNAKIRHIDIDPSELGKNPKILRTESRLMRVSFFAGLRR